MATFQAPNAVEIYEKGLALFDQNLYEEALAAFEKAIELKPKVAVAWISRGVALERLHLHAEALASHEQAITLEPNNFLAWYNKGVQLQELGRYQEAIVAHEHTLKLRPNDIDTLYNLGVELEKIEHYSEALEVYDRILQQDAQDSFTWNRRGFVLDYLGMYPEAVEAFDRAIQIQPNLAEAWSNRGLALYNLQKYQEAVTSFDQALSLNPTDKIALNNRSLAEDKISTLVLPTVPKVTPTVTPTPATKGFRASFKQPVSKQPGQPQVKPPVKLVKPVAKNTTPTVTPTPKPPIQLATPKAEVIIGASPSPASSSSVATPASPSKVESISSIGNIPQNTMENIPENTITNIPQPSPLKIAGKIFTSRLMTGTGKYRSIEETQASIAASGCQIVTVAVRRVQANTDWEQGLAQALDWSKLWMLPNTAGCQTAEEAVRVARLGREMAKLMGQEDNNFIKLEVIPDAKYLLPDPLGTLEAAEVLVNEGFAVLPYINADPILAERLQAMGCATLMPLGSPIGSGQGIKNAENIAIIIENAVVPVVIDAGIGTPSEAAQAMEMGADALLVNTAIAQAQNPEQMARAMALATIAGRWGYLAGRIPVRSQAQASSPLSGVVK